MSKSKQIEILQQRVAELENALRPFAAAADGFDDGDIYIEYRETDKNYYQIYIDNEALTALTTQHLIAAAKVMPMEVELGG